MKIVDRMTMQCNKKPISRCERDLEVGGENKINRAVEVAFCSEEDYVNTVGEGCIWVRDSWIRDISNRP